MTWFQFFFQYINDELTQLKERNAQLEMQFVEVTKQLLAEKSAAEKMVSFEP